MRHNNAVAVALKGAVAGISRSFAFRQFNLKVAAAANGQIQRVVGIGQAGTVGNTVNGGGSDTETQLNAGRHNRVGRRRRRTRTDNVLIQKIVKFGSSFRIGRSVHVGDVVGNNVHVGLLCQHSRCADC